jgi:hypothetical protein
MPLIVMAHALGCAGHRKDRLGPVEGFNGHLLINTFANGWVPCKVSRSL